MRLIVSIGFCLISHWLCAQVDLEKVERGVSTTAAEDSPMLSTDGHRLVFLRSVTNEWPALVYRQVWQLSFDNVEEAQSLGLDSVYTISYAYDGSALFFTRRTVWEQGERIAFYEAKGQPGNWQITNISERDGIMASYAHQVKDGSLYFFQYNGPEGTGLYRSQWSGTHFEAPQWLGAELSPAKTTTFSPYVSPDEDWMIFTSYFEEDGEQGRTGFYFARKVAGRWQKQQIKGLPYGWNASLSANGQYLYFTDGSDVYRCLVKDLGIDFDFEHR